MRTAIVVLAGLLLAAVLVGAGLFVWGTQLPEAHTATASAIIPASPPDVFQRLADARAHPDWRPGVKAVEVRDDAHWTEDGENGRIPFRVVEASPPSRLIVAIDTEDLPFEGTWTYVLTPTAGGTNVAITEDGRVKSAMFRALGRLFFPPDRTATTMLEDLRRLFERN